MVHSLPFFPFFHYTISGTGWRFDCPAICPVRDALSQEQRLEVELGSLECVCSPSRTPQTRFTLLVFLCVFRRLRRGRPDFLLCPRLSSQSHLHRAREEEVPFLSIPHPDRGLASQLLRVYVFY